MVKKANAPRGRPIKNTVDKIPAPPKQIARAIFRAAEKKTVISPKPMKKKPN